MKDFKLTNQAFKELKKLAKSGVQTAKRIKLVILKIRSGESAGKALQGYSDFFKVRVGKFRLIHTTINGVLIIAIIEKME